MKRNKLIVGIGLLLIGIFALYGVATAGMHFVTGWSSWDTGSLDRPHGIAVDSSGNVYVGEFESTRILKFDGSGALLGQWGGFDKPRGIAVDSSGYNIYIYVADAGDCIQVFNGTSWTTWGVYGYHTYDPGKFADPHGIAVDSTNGYVYVADTQNNRIQKTSDGTSWTTWGQWNSGDFDQPRGIAVDSSGNVYVADTNNHRILKFDGNGALLGQWGGAGTAAGQFMYPRGIAVDSSGNVYVADTGQYLTGNSNNRIQWFDGTTWTTLGGPSPGSGNYEFSFPSGIAVDSPNGYVYVADTHNNRVQKFSLNSPPTVGEIMAPLDPVQVGTEIVASATFTDDGDTHTAEWNWDDGNICVIDETSATPEECGSITDPGPGGSRTVTGYHTYGEDGEPGVGVYMLTLAVTDDDGASGEATYQYVVIYDPDEGFVTGGGWIDSPEGAYAEDPLLIGKANFGFVSKYKKGATVPTGETEFNFKVAEMNFHSDRYEWLVVAGPKAMYKGCGTINGEGNYGFMLSAIDAALTPSTDVDLFRIKIWDKDNDDAVVYDNQMDDADYTDPITEIGGGSIVIHQ